MIQYNRLILCVPVIAFFFPEARGASEGSESRPPCGLAALSELCRLEGVDPGIELLSNHLGKMPPRGYSMAQLSRAAGDFGLNLHGVRIGVNDPPGRRPFLAHVSREGEGHFFVVVPRANTSTEVLVIDPLGETRIVPFDRLVRLPGWSGIALMRDQQEWVWLLSRELTVCVCVYFFVPVLLFYYWHQNGVRNRDIS